jgi:hypothetical protein
MGEKNRGQEEGRLKGTPVQRSSGVLDRATPNGGPPYGEPGIALTGLHADTGFLLHHLQEVASYARTRDS